MTGLRSVFAGVAFVVACLPAVGQVPLPQILNVGNINYGGGAVLSGAFTNANQPAGTGYTLRQFGNSGTGGAVLFSGSNTNPAVLTISTRMFDINGDGLGDASAPNSAPDAFSTTTAYSFNIFAPRNPSASILIPRIAGGTDYFDLSSSSTEISQAQARLNEALKFNPSQFKDTNGNTVTPAVGTFFYTLELNTAMTAYSNINLNYTPVPEPVGLLALAVGGLAGVRRRRRRVLA